MDKKENNVIPEKQAKKEQAVNKTATQGENVNPQVEQKREKHRPRDNA
ncbi:MAG: hypothetical protein ACI9V1_003432 [Spirosomataceae bacterium]|jgi:hypothetical protein